MTLVHQVMTREPYASAKRVFWIVDNGSSPRGKKAIDRLAKAFPNALMVHTPVHASWTNQIEIFFSIVQRKVVQPNDFTDLTQVRDRLRAFEDRICWPGSTDTLSIGRKNPLPVSPRDQPPKDFERRPLSRAIEGAGAGAGWLYRLGWLLDGRASSCRMWSRCTNVVGVRCGTV